MADLHIRGGLILFNFFLFGLSAFDKYLTKHYQREPISTTFAFKFCDTEQKNKSIIDHFISFFTKGNCRLS
ncbi:hypothetical protein OH685_06605 [Acinetobacter pittii]|nr:hypothetical protein OH685_06605 [Acinetobacter pittii]